MLEQDLPTYSATETPAGPSSRVVISSLDALGHIPNPEVVTAVHLTRAAFFASNFIQILVEKLPSLKEVEGSPQMVDIFLSNLSRRILEEKGIDIRKAYLVEGKGYNQQSSGYLEKQQTFREIFTNPERKDNLELFQRMEKAEMPVVKYLRRYFGDEAKTLYEISQEYGLSYRIAARDIAAFLHLIGRSSLERQIVSRARSFLRQLERTEERKRVEEFREGFRVGEYLPPSNIPKGRWETWRKIIQIHLSNPKKWEMFKKNFPRCYLIIVNFYQIENEAEHFSGKPTLASVGSLFSPPLTGERVRQLRKKGLAILERDIDEM